MPMYSEPRQTQVDYILAEPCASLVVKSKINPIEPPVNPNFFFFFLVGDKMFSIIEVSLSDL